MKLNAACLLIWPFWVPCNEQFNSMNDNITTSHSAWKVKWLPNRTESDQGSKREGVYTMLNSEQFMRTYYYERHPLGGARQWVQQAVCYGWWKFCVKYISFIAHQSTAASLCTKSAYPVTTVVLRSVKKDVLYNTFNCNCVYVVNFIFQNRCEPQ